MAIQNSLDGFRNTLNVRNNSKASRWFSLIRSATSCYWFSAVTEKSFAIAIRLKDIRNIFLSLAFESSEDGRHIRSYSEYLSKLRQLFSLGLNFGKKEFILKSVTIRKLSSRKT